MQADLSADWHWIVRRFEKGLKTSRFYTFATTNPDGTAHLTPIASLVFNGNCTGYYSEVFPGRMARNLITDQRLCVMAVCMGSGYWFKSLLTGRFAQWPALRIYGTAARKVRKAKPGEIDRWRQRVNRYRPFKGYALLWKDIRFVRDIEFDRVEPVRMGPMTRHLDQGRMA